MRLALLLGRACRTRVREDRAVAARNAAAALHGAIGGRRRCGAFPRHALLAGREAIEANDSGPPLQAHRVRDAENEESRAGVTLEIAERSGAIEQRLTGEGEPRDRAVERRDGGP